MGRPGGSAHILFWLFHAFPEEGRPVAKAVKTEIKEPDLLSFCCHETSLSIFFLVTHSSPDVNSAPQHIGMQQTPPLSMGENSTILPAPSRPSCLFLSISRSFFSNNIGRLELQEFIHRTRKTGKFLLQSSVFRHARDTPLQRYRDKLTVVRGGPILCNEVNDLGDRRFVFVLKKDSRYLFPNILSYYVNSSQDFSVVCKGS